MMNLNMRLWGNGNFDYQRILGPASVAASFRLDHGTVSPTLDETHTVAS